MPSTCRNAAATASSTGCGLLLIDCDRFKQVNDEHGHLVGDRVLQSVASILRSVAGPDDIACRLGGDEFCLLVKADTARPCSASPISSSAPRAA